MVILCIFGLFINIGKVFKIVLDIIDCVQEIVLMGGVYFEVGNIMLVVEFNIYVDFEVVEIVFKLGFLIIVMFLDVMYKVLIIVFCIQVLCDFGIIVGIVMVEMVDFFECFDVEKYGFVGVLLYDFCVIVYLLKFEFF